MGHFESPKKVDLLPPLHKAENEVLTFILRRLLSKIYLPFIRRLLSKICLSKSAFISRLPWETTSLGDWKSVDLCLMGIYNDCGRVFVIVFM